MQNLVKTICPLFGLYLDKSGSLKLDEKRTIKDGQKVPLESVNYNIQIFENIAEIEIVQIYENKSDKPADVCYYFPKALESNFVELTCVIDGVEIVTAFEKREVAAKKYQDAVQKGNIAVMSTTPLQPVGLISRDSSMKIFIGNFPAKKALVAKFRVVYDIPTSLNSYNRFLLPLEIRNLHPGFTDQGMRNDSIFVPFFQVNNHLVQNPLNLFDKKTFGLEHKPSTNEQEMKIEAEHDKAAQTFIDEGKGHLWTMNIKLNCLKSLKNVISPSHKIIQKNTLSGLAIELDYKMNETIPWQDFVLYYQTEYTNKPSILFGADKSESLKNFLGFNLRFDLYSGIQETDEDWVKVQCEDDKADLLKNRAAHQLNQISDIKPAEYIFLVDRSGSMGFTKSKGKLLIQLAVEALVFFVQSLPEGSIFNVVSYGDKFEYMFEKSVENNEQNVDFCLEKLKTFKDNFGGTNIKGPVESVLKNPKVNESFGRYVFLLTDGCVSNTTEVVNVITENLGDTRVFSFGLGSGSDKDLIDKVSHAGKGKCEYVLDASEIIEKVIYMLESTTERY